MATRKTGPCGGPGGGAYDMNINGISRIISITIGSGSLIDSIKVSYMRNGRQEDSDKWGGGGGGIRTSYLAADEYITAVKGSVGRNSVLQSLTFETNKGATFGPFGSGGGMPFELSAPNCQIIGFHGHSGTLVDALGVYIQSLRLTP